MDIFCQEKFDKVKFLKPLFLGIYRDKGKGDKFNFPGYPLEEQEQAAQTALEQAELLALR